MSLFLQLSSFIALLSFYSDAFCPQGFGGESDFPDDWKIPKWPSMDLESASELRTVTLGGFVKTSINEEYLEGPGEEFSMQGRETYWQASGKFFMYYCERFTKWRIAEISAFSQNKEGNCFAFVSDAHKGRDILNETHIKEWIEVEDGNWVVRKDAGVVQVGKLADQIAAQEEDEEEVVDESNCTSDDNETDGPFGKKKSSSCPVMPVVRKARDNVVKAAKAAGKWVQRLFPKFGLGTPDEEDAMPEADNPLFADDEYKQKSQAQTLREAEKWRNSLPKKTREDNQLSDCQPDTQENCNFKEKFYIEKQQKVTVDKRKSELERLAKMQDVVMKPEQTEWLMARVHILRHLVSKDEL